MKFFIQPLVYFLIGCAGVLDAQIKTIPYQQLQGTSGMYFGANMSTSSITITFAGPSDRWIGIGFGISMTPCDALVYTSGQSSSPVTQNWYDYYCGNTSATNVTNDSQQDWTVVSTATASGQRTVVATRILNTNDINDAVFTYSASSLDVVWARGNTASYVLAYHGITNRGSGISLPWLTPPVAGFTTSSSATVCAGTNVSFSNTSTGGQNTYTWSFSGANLASSSLTNPVVSYTAPGTFSVALTASNALGSASVTQLNYITVTPTIIPSVNILQTAGNNPICAGSAASFSANAINGSISPVFQWRVNGINSGSNSSVFTTSALTPSALISCVITTNSLTCAVPNTATSSAITLTVNSSAPASVSVAAAIGSNPICSGSTASFVATSGNGGSSPIYQWKVNNINAGTNSSVFTSSVLANGDVVTCEIISSATCAISTTAVSSPFTMTVSNVLTPSVSINLSAGNPTICSGNSVTFSASPVNGGVSPNYQWLVGGVNIPSSGPNTSSVVLLTGVYAITCVMSSNLSCASPTTATSTPFIITVNAIPAAPSISPSGKVSLCSGKSLTLSSSVINGNVWSTGANTRSIVVTNAGNYSVSRTVNGCVSPTTGVMVSVIPSPVVTLSTSASLCNDDAPIELFGSPAGGTYSGTAVNSNSFSPNISGLGTFTIAYQYTALNNCSNTSSTSIQVAACTSVNEFSERAFLIAYPNPTQEVVTIQSTSKNLRWIRVVNTQGKIVKEVTPLMAEVAVNITLPLPGIYFVEALIDSFVMRTKVIRSE